MFVNVNCKSAINPGGWCKDKRVKRSLFGLGSRCCVKYMNNDAECAFHVPFDRPPPPPPPPPPPYVPVQRVEIIRRPFGIE